MNATMQLAQSSIMLSALTKTISVIILACLFLSGCASDSFHYSDRTLSMEGSSNDDGKSLPASGIHRVQRGDTLFSIAFTYGLDYRALASLNGIPSPYTIYPNQKIRLSNAAVRETRTPASNSTATRVSPPVSVAKNADRKVNSSSTKVSTVTIPDEKVASWSWPITGSVTKGFSNAGVSSKGIDIKGKEAEHVKAAADGVVVYAGNGLIGYGNLVIVKHNDVYLSAYAYNERILVKEKQSVRAGDSLAIIGGKGSERPLLHFEVRRDGQPIDPLKVLPKK